MRGARTLAFVALLASAGCATARLTPMQRALDPSMERVLRVESYLRTVAGISAKPERLTRSDGYIYMADVAPQLRYMAAVGDTARYQALRGFIVERLMKRADGGLVPMRRYRSDASFEPVTLYGYLWLTKALHDGWTLLGDTASAEAIARLKGDMPPPPANATTYYRLTTECGDAMDVIDTDPARARRVLAAARRAVGSAAAEAEQNASGVSVVEGEVDLLSCLVRVGLKLNDPDAAVRNLEHMLGHLMPLLIHSGRPDLGTSTDILLTLRRVKQAGPEYYDPAYYQKRSASRR